MKVCTRCKIEKSFKDFHKDRTSTDGFYSSCKSCKSLSAKTPKYYAYGQTYRQTKKEEIRAKNRRYREKNKEKYIQYYKDRYISKKEHIRNLNKIWEKENPDKVIEKRHRRRAKFLGGGTYSTEDWNNLCKKFNYMCVACYKVKKLTVDHIVPISKGGSNTIDNIQPLCLSCNSSKGARVIDYTFWFMVA